MTLVIRCADADNADRRGTGETAISNTPTVALETVVGAAVEAPSPSVTLRALFAFAPRPMAMPEVAAEVTLDCPPMAIALVAATDAPPLAFESSAVAPAAVAFAFRPMVEEKSALALAPEPMARLRSPRDTALVPSARPFVAFTPVVAA